MFGFKNKMAESLSNSIREEAEKETQKVNILSETVVFGKYYQTTDGIYLKGQNADERVANIILKSVKVHIDELNLFEPKIDIIYENLLYDKVISLKNMTKSEIESHIASDVAFKSDMTIKPFIENVLHSDWQNVEYKKTWRDEYLKWICAFANTEGGKLYIGVKDDGVVCGVDDAHKLSEDIPNKVRNTMGLICTVNLLSKNGLDYFEIITEKYPFPVSYHGKYYKRTGSTIQEVSGVELDKMILSVQGRTWDSIPVPHISVDDLENDAIKLFKKKAKESGRLDDAALDVSNETLIQNLHITECEYLTRACMLAFHPDPEMWVTGAYIKVAYFENDADIFVASYSRNPTDD